MKLSCVWLNRRETTLSNVELAQACQPAGQTGDLVGGCSANHSNI